MPGQCLLRIGDPSLPRVGVLEEAQDSGGAALASGLPPTYYRKQQAAR